MTKNILNFIGELVIADMIAESNEKEQENKKLTKKKIEPPVVCITDKNIVVAFDKNDTEGITEFNDFAESIPCNMIKEENVFTIKANIEILYLCIYHLTLMYFGIVIC